MNINKRHIVRILKRKNINASYRQFEGDLFLVKRIQIMLLYDRYVILYIYIII